MAWRILIFFFIGSSSLAAPAPHKSLPVPKSAKEPHLLKIMKLSTQADQIHREAWRVLSGERRPPAHSAFGKVQRAADMAVHGKLQTKGVFDCDRYAFQKIKDVPWTGVFAEQCHEKSPRRDFATWTFTGTQDADVEFQPVHLAEVLGLSASIFAKRFSCHLTWNNSELIEKMSCPDWEQERGKQIIRLSTFEYERQGHQILRMKGQVLEDLRLVKKIETEVPLEGKIVVTETELTATGENKFVTSSTTTTLHPKDLKRKSAPVGIGKPPVPSSGQGQQMQQPNPQDVEGGPPPTVIYGNPVYVDPGDGSPGYYMVPTYENPAKQAPPQEEQPQPQDFDPANANEKSIRPPGEQGNPATGEPAQPPSGR